MAEIGDDEGILGNDFAMAHELTVRPCEGAAEAKGQKVSAIPGGDPVPLPHSVGRGNRRGSG